MSDTTLTIGDITLAGFEIPQKVPFGGRQIVAKHQLVGGNRVLDNLGPDDKPIKWSGIIFSQDGQTANDRAQSIEYLRRQGQPATLTWWSLSYSVLITSFDPDWERYYQIPYEIECTVIQNLSAPTSASQPTADQLVGSDQSSVLNTAQNEMDMTVPSNIPSPQSTYAGVSSPPTNTITWNGGSGNGLNLTEVASALTDVRALLAGMNGLTGLSSSTTASSVALIEESLSTIVSTQALGDGMLVVPSNLPAGTNCVGGVVSGVSGQINAAAFNTYAATCQDCVSLINTGSSLNRMADNLSIANSGQDVSPIDWSDSDDSGGDDFFGD